MVEPATDKPKTLIASSWTKSANVNSVRLEESPHESKTLHSILDFDCCPLTTLYHSMEEHLTATGHALFALRSDLLRWDPGTHVDMMDVFPGSDTEDKRNDSGFLRGPSDGMQSRLVSIFVRNLLHCQEYRYYSTVCNVLCTELVLLYSHVIIDSLGLYAVVGQVLREEGCRVVDVDTTNMVASRAFMQLIRFTGMPQCGTLLCNKKHCRTALFKMIATVESLLQHLKGQMYAPLAHSSAFAFVARTLAACDGAHIIDQEHISRYPLCNASRY